jgi:hypothetical protein
MSGGSMDYLSCKLLDANFREDSILRKAFRKHLNLVAKALHDIEWNDSAGDGADTEEESIRSCISPFEELETSIEEAKEILEDLKIELTEQRG